MRHPGFQDRNPELEFRAHHPPHYLVEAAEVTLGKNEDYFIPWIEQVKPIIGEYIEVHTSPFPFTKTEARRSVIILTPPD